MKEFKTALLEILKQYECYIDVIRYKEKTQYNKLQTINKRTNKKSSSSSSCRAVSMDIPDPLSPLLRIIHLLWQVFRVTSCVLT